MVSPNSKALGLAPRRKMEKPRWKLATPATSRAVNKNFQSLGIKEQSVLDICSRSNANADAKNFEVVPLILEKEELYAIAHEGPERVMSYMLPLLQLMPAKQNGVFGLILCCSRRLAEGVCCILKELLKDEDTTFCKAVGSSRRADQEKELKAMPNFVVATPTRLFSILECQPELRACFGQCEFLVLEEAVGLEDFPLEMGKIKEWLPPREKMKTLAFSDRKVQMAKLFGKNQSQEAHLWHGF